MLQTTENPFYYLENCINTLLSSNEANRSQDGEGNIHKPTHSDSQRVRVQLRTNKKLKEGDLSLFIPSFRGHDGHQQQQKGASDFASELTKQPLLKAYLTKCSSSTQAHFSIVLNRPTVFRDIVINVMTRGENYGNFTTDEKPCYVVVTDMRFSNCEYGCLGTQKGLTLDQLRTKLVADHLRGAIAVSQEQTTGHMASAVSCEKSADCVDNFGNSSTKMCTLSFFSPSCLCTDVHSTDISAELLAQTTEQCATAIRNCQYVTWVHTCSRFGITKDDKNNSPGGSVGCRPDDNYTLLAQQQGHERGLGQFDDGCPLGVLEFEKLFAVHKDLQVGFDKNLIKSRVAVSKEFLSSLSRMELLAQQSGKQPGDGPCRLVHVCSCRNQFTTQQEGVAWRITSHNVFAQNQLFLSHGLVSCHEAGRKLQRTLSAEDFLRLREQQLTQSYLLKYGNVVEGPGWEDSIRQMAIATVKIEILSTSLKNTVKLDVSDSSQEFREATFVMYNCARLHTLLQHFNHNVTKEIYPPLPPVDQVDFALLKDQAEWELLVRYVMSYPSVVKEVMDSLGRTNGSLVHVHTSRISVFLVSLSHEFSSYYGRVHILGEPKAHLFPVMFARLYLTKALQQVVHNCLKLLNIVPLTQM